MSRLPTFDPGFSTDELSSIYSAEGTVGAILEFEEALALALADTGIAPVEEADEVATACRGEVDDPGSILASTWAAGTPLIAVRDVIIPRIGSESARRWFHFGATTQDSIDTAQMIQAAAALEALTAGLTSIASSLRDLTIEHRDRAQQGRTFLQDARPSTFGFRTATWLDAVLSNVEDLRSRQSGLVVQLGGPVGTTEMYGDKAPDVIAALASRLGLEAPDISWQGNRSRVKSITDAVTRCADTMAKIGYDIALLASSAISEIRVRSGGSSSMPGKENPVDSLRAVAAAAACSGAAAMLSSAPPFELDRGIGGWHVEWIAVPLVMQTAGAAIEAIEVCLSSLELPDDVGKADDAVLAGVSGAIDAILQRAGRILG